MTNYRRKLVCPRPSCGHAWTYKGKKTEKKKFYTSCPICKTSVKINQKKMPVDAPAQKV